MFRTRKKGKKTEKQTESFSPPRTPSTPKKIITDHNNQRHQRSIINPSNPFNPLVKDHVDQVDDGDHSSIKMDMSSIIHIEATNHFSPLTNHY